MASSPYLSLNRVAGAALESTPGTAVAAAYDVELYDVGAVEIDYSMATLGKPAIGNFQKGKQYSGALKCSTKAKDALRYSGAIGTAPKNAKFLKMAGYRQALDGSAVQFIHDGKPDWTTGSMRVVDMGAGQTPDAIEKTMKGCVANLVISAANVGAPVAMEYTINGAYNVEGDTASIPVVTGVDAADAEKYLGAVIDFGGEAYCVNSFSLDLGNVLTPIYCPNESQGVIAYEITDCNPKLTCSLRKVDIVTSGLPTLMLADDVLAGWKISTSHFEFEFVKAQITSRKDADTDGQVFENLEFQIDSHTITLK